MSSIDYITFPIDSEPEDLLADAIATIQATFPNWQPIDGALDTVLLETVTATAADVRDVASQVPTAIFRYFGSTLMGINPIDAVPATVQATVTASDNQGHTIPAGTQMGIRDSAGVLQPFYVQSAVTIPAGSIATGAGAVTLIAVVGGLAGSNLGSPGGTVELVDPVTWVASVTQVAITSGGQDAETDTEYLNRLRAQLRLLTPRPIVPADFAALAKNVGGVGYAFAINGYNPQTATFGNEKTVTVVCMDASGLPVSAAVKAAVATYLQSLREVNFLVFVIDPTFVLIDVTYDVALLPGYDSATVVANVNATLQLYLDPAAWAASAPLNSNPSLYVRYLELAQVINGVTGVDYIRTMTFGVHGGALNTTDVLMTGAAPLPDASTLTGTAS